MANNTQIKWGMIPWIPEKLKTNLSNSVSLDKIKGELNIQKNFLVGKEGTKFGEMNEIAVAIFASSFCNELKLTGNRIIVASDLRSSSEIFAGVVRSVLAANGVQIVVDELNVATTPEMLSHLVIKEKLAGAVLISGDNLKLGHNAIKIIDKNGEHLSKSVMSNIFDEMDWESIPDFLSEYKTEVLGGDLINGFVKKFSNLALGIGDGNGLKAIFSNQHGSGSNFIPNILEGMYVDFKSVEKNNVKKTDFKGASYFEDNISKVHKDMQVGARKENADLLLATNYAATEIMFGVRHKRRFKFVTSDQLAVVFIEMHLEKLKAKKLLRKGDFIIISDFSSELVSKIAENYGVGTIRASIAQENITDIIGKEKGRYLFGYDGNSYSLPDLSFGIPGAAQGLACIYEVLKNCSEMEISFYDKLQLVFAKYGVHRLVKYSYELNADKRKTIRKRILKIKNIGKHNVLSVVDNTINGSGSVLLYFKDGSKLSINFCNRPWKTVFYIESAGNRGQEIIDILVFEKQVEEWVKDNLETFEDKKFSWKTVLKYSIFTTILCGIMAIVFTNIYHSASSNSASGVFTVVQALFARTNRWVWISLWLWTFFTKFLSAWVQIRMFQRLGIKVKAIHLVISSMMSAVIAFVTPFAVGGDAIGYWYLRRKGVPRAGLISVMASSTLWGETRYALQTIIFIAVGYDVYADIFTLDSPTSIATLVWFIVGAVWAWFAAFMLLVLTMHKRVQEFITRNSVKFLEWMPFMHLSDPEKVMANTQYQFFLIRDGMKRIWTKWWFILEIMFYTLLPMFLIPTAIVTSLNGSINKGLPLGPYWAQLITGDISGTANSLSITPGGSGTGEWLNINIKNYLYKGSDIFKENSFTTKELSSGADFFRKIFMDWPGYVLSIMSIGLVLTIDNGRLGKRLSTKSKTVISISTLMVFIGSLMVLYFLI